MTDDYVMPTALDGSPLYPDLTPDELRRVQDCTDGMRAAGRLNESELGMLFTRLLAHYRAQKSEIVRLTEALKDLIPIVDTSWGPGAEVARANAEELVHYGESD